MSRWHSNGGRSFHGLVVCPGCAGRADALFRWPAASGDGWVMPGRWTRATRITCAACGYAREFEHGTKEFELWLRCECRGEQLWAFGLEHLRGITRFLELGGTLDEEPGHPASMEDLSGLPAWMYRHRAEVAECLELLKTRAV